jgi:hypothetical protein
MLSVGLDLHKRYSGERLASLVSSHAGRWSALSRAPGARSGDWICSSLGNSPPHPAGTSVLLSDADRVREGAHPRGPGGGEALPLDRGVFRDYSLPIGGIRDSGLNGATDKIEEMAYIKRVHLAT